jgi:hypothetical protein
MYSTEGSKSVLKSVVVLAVVPESTRRPTPSFHTYDAGSVTV